MSTREKIRQAKPKVESVEISSGTVHVRALSGSARAAYMRLVREHSPDVPPSHLICALGLCEADGKLVYDLSKPEDLAELEEIEATDADKIAVKLFEASGLTKSAVENAEKKSEASPS